MRVLLTPRWVVAHVLVVLIIAGCVTAGFWQLRRLEERQAANALLSERMAMPPAPLDELLGGVAQEPDARTDSLEQLEFRRVVVTGRYLDDAQLLLSPRSRAGSPGHDVLSPLRTEDGTVVVIDRGFVPFRQEVPPSAPAGEVVVEGMVRLSQERVGIGPRIPPVEVDDHLERVARVDLDRLAAQLPQPLAPVFVELAGPPPAAGGPRPVEPPVLEEANHRSYAVQWFLFALVGAVGYPLLLRKTVVEAQAEAEPDAVPRPPLPVG